MRVRIVVVLIVAKESSLTSTMGKSNSSNDQAPKGDQPHEPHEAVQRKSRHGSEPNDPNLDTCGGLNISVLEVPRGRENISLDYVHLLDRLQGRLSFAAKYPGDFLVTSRAWSTFRSTFIVAKVMVLVLVGRWFWCDGRGWM